MKRKRCLCCGYKTIDAELQFEICPVCFWQDDDIQNKNPDYSGGANAPSLNQARDNFKKFGAVEKRLIKYVRNPKPEEK